MESQTMVRWFIWIGRCSTWRIQDHDDWRGFSSKKVWVSPLDFHWNRIHVSGDWKFILLLSQCWCTSRDHIPRVFLNPTYLLVFLIPTPSIISTSSGNRGVAIRSFFLSSKIIKKFPKQSEGTLKDDFFHRSWPEFNPMNSSSTKIGVLVVELVLPYVQCKSLRSPIERSTWMKKIAPIAVSVCHLVPSLPWTLYLNGE